MGLAMGAFAAPNRAGIMNSLPKNDRGAGSGMNSTFQNSAQVLSIGIFFSLVIVGLSASLPLNLSHGLIHAGVKASVANKVAHHIYLTNIQTTDQLTKNEQLRVTYIFRPTKGF